MAEGSQTFEEDIARLITEERVTREEGLAQADSPTNLMWRLQNRKAPATRKPTTAPCSTRSTNPPSPTSRSTCRSLSTCLVIRCPERCSLPNN